MDPGQLERRSVLIERPDIGRRTRTAGHLARAAAGRRCRSPELGFAMLLQAMLGVVLKTSVISPGGRRRRLKQVRPKGFILLSHPFIEMRLRHMKHRALHTLPSTELGTRLPRNRQTWPVNQPAGVPLTEAAQTYEDDPHQHAANADGLPRWHSYVSSANVGLALSP